MGSTKGCKTARTQTRHDERTNTPTNFFAVLPSLQLLYSCTFLDRYHWGFWSLRLRARCNGRAGREDIVSESIHYYHHYTCTHMICDCFKTSYYLTTRNFYILIPSKPTTYMSEAPRRSNYPRAWKELTSTTPRTCVVDLPKVWSLGISALIPVTQSKLPQLSDDQFIQGNKQGVTRCVGLDSASATADHVCVDIVWDGRLVFFRYRDIGSA